MIKLFSSDCFVIVGWSQSFSGGLSSQGQVTPDAALRFVVSLGPLAPSPGAAFAAALEHCAAQPSAALLQELWEFRTSKLHKKTLTEILKLILSYFQLLQHLRGALRYFTVLPYFFSYTVDRL